MVKSLVMLLCTKLIIALTYERGKSLLYCDRLLRALSFYHERPYAGNVLIGCLKPDDRPSTTPRLYTNTYTPNQTMLLAWPFYKIERGRCRSVRLELDSAVLATFVTQVIPNFNFQLPLLVFQLYGTWALTFKALST